MLQEASGSMATTNTLTVGNKIKCRWEMLHHPLSGVLLSTNPGQAHDELFAIGAQERKIVAFTF